MGRTGSSGLLYTQLKFGWTPTEYANYSAINSTRYAFGCFVLTTLYREEDSAAAPNYILQIDYDYMKALLLLLYF